MIKAVSVRVFKKSNNEFLWQENFFANEYRSYYFFKEIVQSYIRHLSINDNFNVVVNYVLES